MKFCTRREFAAVATVTASTVRPTQPPHNPPIQYALYVDPEDPNDMDVYEAEDTRMSRE